VRRIRWLKIAYIYCKIWTTLWVLLHLLCVVLFQVDSGVMKNKDDFTVVLQPFSDRLTFPVNRFNGTDLSYIAPDCFHLSQKGYARCENTTIPLWIITIIFTFFIDGQIQVHSICQNKYYHIFTTTIFIYFAFQWRTHYGTTWWNPLDKNQLIGLKN